MRKPEIKDIILPILLFLIFLLYFLNFLHYPEARSWRDEGTFYYGAERILNGQLIYRDFHEFQLPGSFYFQAFMFSIFGSTIETGRIVTYVLISLGLCTYFLLARTFVKKIFLSLLPCFTVAFVGFPQWAGSVPHWFSFFTNATSLFMFSQYIISNSRIFILLSGVFAGLSFTIVQNEGVLLSLGLFIFLIFYDRFSLKKISIFLSGFLIVAVCWPIFFLLKGEFKNFIDDTFFSLFKQYLPANRIPYFGYFTDIVSTELLKKVRFAKNLFGLVVLYLLIVSIYLVQYGLIVIYFFASLKIIKDKYKGKPKDVLDRFFVFLTISGLFLLLSQIHKPDPVRLMFVSLPALTIFMYFISTIMNKSDKIKILTNLIVIFVYVSFFAYGIGIVVDFHKRDKCVLKVPGGKIYYYNEQMCAELNQLYLFVSQNTGSNPRIFIHNWATHYYFLFKWNNPVPVDGLLLGHNTEEQYRNSLNILNDSNPDFVLTDKVIDFILNYPDRTPFPNLNPGLLKKDPIWDFIRANYREIAFLPASGLTLWKRK